MIERIVKRLLPEPPKPAVEQPEPVVGPAVNPSLGPPEPVQHCDSRCVDGCRWCDMFTDLIGRVRALERRLAVADPGNALLKGARP